MGIALLFISQVIANIGDNKCEIRNSMKNTMVSDRICIDMGINICGNKYKFVWQLKHNDYGNIPLRNNMNCRNDMNGMILKVGELKHCWIFQGLSYT